MNASLQRALYDVLFHTYPVWSVALAWLTVPYVLGHRLVEAWHPRVVFKRLLSHVLLIPAFCKECGRDVRDYVAPDTVWRAVEEASGHRVLCYDCFCDVCRELALPTVWRLVEAQ